MVWETTRKVVHNDAELLSVQETRTGAIIAAGRFGYRTGFAPLVLRADAGGRINEIGSVLSYGLDE